MNRTILAASFAAITSLVAAQPSAFGAGNLNNPSPYGLTSSEKTVLQNKKDLNKISVKSNNQANEVDSLRDRIDGLQSVVESLSRKSQRNKTDLAKLQNKNDDELKNSDEYEKRLAEVAEENSKTILKNLYILEELGKVVDTINTNYISKKEFNALVKDVNSFKSLVAKELKSTSKSKSSTLSKMSNPEIAKKAQAFFDTQYYTKGIEYYTYLIKQNYKPANAHFMVGQMKFRRKNYSEAISYYKKSASLYSEASYIPELMLNTAISMDKTNDKKKAKAFYEAVVKKFPQSTEAKSAKKYLKSL